MLKEYAIALYAAAAILLGDGFAEIISIVSGWECAGAVARIVFAVIALILAIIFYCMGRTKSAR